MKRRFMNKMIISLTVVVLAGALAGCSGANDASDPSESSAYESEDIEVPQSFEETESSESESAIQTETEAEVLPDSIVIDGVSYSVGDIYTFGNYGEGDISWIILDIDGDNVMLLSEYAIENKMFNAELVETSWENCSVRSWLNSEFIDSAFTEDEKTKILDTDVLSSVNSEYGTQCGNDTVDKVFLLSLDEFETLVPEEYRCCLVTDYAWRNNVCRYNSNDCCDWFLRTPGTSGKMVVYVTYNGGAYEPGGDVTFSVRGLRPAMWISIAD
ncbi:MAG: DUF6273 domain-containing protein [Saccharofermentans sp.]|nr:DUF6273 domain-containing protein [Saccharofermentans sp.]